MAIIQGISGLTLGDGAGGKIALSVKELVQRILADTQLTYMAATVNNPDSLKFGSAHYYTPELIQVEAYGAAGAGAFQTPQVGLTTITLDKQDMAKYEVETFDVTRIRSAAEVLGQVATGLALAIQNSLNAQFWKFLAAEFVTGTGQLQAQTITLPNLGDAGQHQPDDFYEDYLKLEYKMVEINQTFNKRALGIPKAEVMTVLSPKCDVGLRRAFRNQPNQIGNWQVTKTLEGKYIGNVRYLTEKMFQTNIRAGSSFRKDVGYDFSRVLGFMFHNEAIAFPVNLNTVQYVVNPENANHRWIAKIQYGFGLLRKELIWAITDQGIGVAPFSDVVEAKAEAEAKVTKEVEKMSSKIKGFFKKG